MNPSPFIQAPHPKTSIAPTRMSIQKALAAGWWGQVKIHGHRAQIHLSADGKAPPLVYTRQGQAHKVAMPSELVEELRRLLAPSGDFLAVDAEWLKGENKLFLFDYLKRQGQVLDQLNYSSRYELLPRVYRSKYVETLPILKTVDDCIAVFERQDPWIEGLVFKSPTTIGFRDSAIVRCRKSSAF